MAVSSETLTIQPIQSSTASSHSPPTQDIISALSASPHIFLQPPQTLHNAALSLAKRYLDPLASGVSEAQLQRQREHRRKRKRGGQDDRDGQVLHLKSVHLEGFGVEQVWEQARRVLDAAREEVESALLDVADAVGEDRVYTQVIPGMEGGEGVKVVRFEEDGFVTTGPDKDSDEEDEDMEDEGSDALEAAEDGEEEDIVEQDDEDATLEAGDDKLDEVDEDDLDEDMSQDDQPAETFVADPNGLNDGFFSIDDFNKQSEFLERQDARGDPDNGAASDEEEVDWDADPLAMEPGAGALVADGLDDDEDEDEDGPTFGNGNTADGFGDEDMDDESLEDGDMDGLGGMGNTNNIMYADFFAPPARKASKKKRGRPNPHNFPPADSKGAAKREEDSDNDIERTMSAVHRDLFEDEDPADETDEPLSDIDPADPRSRRSTHERQRAKLAEEIRRLEAANVAKREWTLAGEARAADRPLNSLLEEDLDFERAGKPVPVITAEVSEDIEALIKRRILAGDFDEVRRRRPDDLATGAGAGGVAPRRGRFELDDSKPAAGLAEMYEAEHLQRTDPNYVDARDEKLRKAHREVEALWRDVCGKLDALSSWHYRPKPAAPNLDIRVDAPAISMEDARPTAGGDVTGASVLAPQEVYTAGQERERGEVVTKGGMPVNREEMSREEKLRRRRREKERIKKAGGSAGPKVESKAARERKGVVGDLKKGGVKVIGRKGELRDVEGKAAKGQQDRVGGGSFKL